MTLSFHKEEHSGLILTLRFSVGPNTCPMGGPQSRPDHLLDIPTEELVY